MVLWLHLIWQWMASSLANGHSFSVAMETYQQMCMFAQPACINYTSLVQGNTVQHLRRKESVSNCCGFCECDYYCIERGSCCLEYRFSFRQIKTSTDSSRFRCISPQLITHPEDTLFPKAPDVDQVWMVAICATNHSSYTSDRVTRLCEDTEFETSLETIVPVSDQFHTYRNIYCAYCNGATKPLQNWKLNIFCTDIVSFTEENMLAVIKEKRCNIFYAKTQHVVAQTCRLTSFSISRCNKTGLWPQFDSNIDRACRSFTDPFNSTYKNYFCYVCNTNEPVTLDNWHCSIPREDLPIITPPYSFSYDTDMINEAKNDKLLGCNITEQFPDLKMMKCRDFFCQKDRTYIQNWKTCKPKANFGTDYCFSMFIKLVPAEEYTLRQAQLKQTINLLRIKHFVTDFLRVDRGVVKEIKLFPKYKESSGNPIVEYLVAYLIVNVAEAQSPDILRVFVQNMNAGNIDTKSINNENFVFHSSLALYNITSDVSGKNEIIVPNYNSLDSDTLQELDLKATDVYSEFSGNYAENSCRTKESRTFKKTEILPFIKIGLNELAMRIENDSLILNEDYMRKVFTSFEYEVHQDVIHLCLEDYVFIYDVMPNDRAHNKISRASFLTKSYLSSIKCAFVASFYLLLPH